MRQDIFISTDSTNVYFPSSVLFYSIISVRLNAEKGLPEQKFSFGDIGESPFIHVQFCVDIRIMTGYVCRVDIEFLSL